jgi:phage-related protein
LPKPQNISPVFWVGDSKKQLKKMPGPVQDQLGGELYLAQLGIKPPHAKPLKGVGQGVFELKDDYDTDTYRLIYAMHSKHLFVLHAFKKKSRRGIETSKRDIKLIAKRFKATCEKEKDSQS